MKFDAVIFEEQVQPLRAFILQHCIRVLRSTSDSREMKYLSTEYELSDEEIRFIQIKLH